MFTAPIRTNDGRYIVRFYGEDKKPVFKQVNRATISSVEDTSCILNIDDTSVFDGVDETFVAALKENGKQWLGKELSDKVIESAYQAGVTDNEITVPFVFSKGNLMTKFFSHDRTPIEMTDLEDGAVCDVILEVSGIWFLKKTFGPIWRLVQLKQSRPPSKPRYTTECMFQADEEVDEDDDDDIISSAF